MEPDIYRQFYEFEKEHWWSKGMRHLCASMISRYCEPTGTGRILDIGCGTGELTRSLGRFGSVIGADYSGDAISFCIMRGLGRVVRTSAENAGFKDSSFSTAVAFCLIEHIEDDCRFLKEMHRVISDGGHIVILTSAFKFLWSYHDDLAHHKRRYTAGHLRKLLESNGFRVRKLSYANSFIFPAVAAIRLVQKMLKVRHNPSGRFLLDIVSLPPFVNRMLLSLLKAESGLLKFMNFPFGVSLICVAQKI